MRIVGKKTERKTNISLFQADIHTYKLTFVSFFLFFLHLSLRYYWGSVKNYKVLKGPCKFNNCVSARKPHPPWPNVSSPWNISVPTNPHMAQEVWGARGRRPQLDQRTQKTKKREAKKREKTRRKAQRKPQRKAQRRQTKSPSQRRRDYKREYTPPLSPKSSPKGLAVPR